MGTLPQYLSLYRIAGNLTTKYFGDLAYEGSWREKIWQFCCTCVHGSSAGLGARQLAGLIWCQLNKIASSPNINHRQIFPLYGIH